MGEGPELFRTNEHGILKRVKSEPVWDLPANKTTPPIEPEKLVVGEISGEDLKALNVRLGVFRNQVEDIASTSPRFSKNFQELSGLYRDADMSNKTSTEVSIELKSLAAVYRENGIQGLSDYLRLVEKDSTSVVLEEESPIKSLVTALFALEQFILLCKYKNETSDKNIPKDVS